MRGRPPQRRVTASDVAREAGVSQATVSYVLNDTPGQTIPEQTRQRVRTAVDRLGYAPHAAARALRRGRSDTVLFVLPEWPWGPTLVTIIEGLTEGLEPHGFSLLTRRVSTNRPLAELWRSLAPAAVVSFEGADPAEVTAMRESGILVMTALLHPREGAEGVLTASQTLAGALQLRHLAARGHRRIGYAAPDDPRVAAFCDLRLAGVGVACRELGLARPSVRVVPLDLAAAVDAVAAWRAQDPAVTAVCAYNDDLAVALLAGVRASGLSAPGDLAVIGVDDTPLAPFAAPPLTTVNMNEKVLARYLTAAVVQGIAGGDPPRPPRSEGVSLVVRESA